MHVQVISAAVAGALFGQAARLWWQSRKRDRALDTFIHELCRVIRDPNETWSSQITETGEWWYVSFVNKAHCLEVCAESSDDYSPGCVIRPAAPNLGPRHQRMLDDAIAVARTHELLRKLAAPTEPPK